MQGRRQVSGPIDVRSHLTCDDPGALRSNRAQYLQPCAGACVCAKEDLGFPGEIALYPGQRARSVMANGLGAPSCGQWNRTPVYPVRGTRGASVANQPFIRTSLSWQGDLQIQQGHQDAHKCDPGDAFSHLPSEIFQFLMQCK